MISEINIAVYLRRVTDAFKHKDLMIMVKKPDSAKIKYIVITPVRNEEKYIEKTIKCMISQTVIPSKWIIVDDGSIDKTETIIDHYAKRYHWINPIHRDNRGFRKAGGGVIDAFYDAYATIQKHDFDFLVKLDGDLSFENDYFEKCFEYFNRDRKLGIGGGVICHFINSSLIPEKTPRFHVRGATKIYKKECWDAIEPLIRAPGWDTLDEVSANMYGWHTRSFHDLQVIHHRYTGSADGTWPNLIKFGRANYISGYHPLFMIAKCLKRIPEKPFLIGSFALWYGFFSGYLHRIPQVEDRDLIKYLRRQQMRRIMGRSSMWK